MDQSKDDEADKATIGIELRPDGWERFQNAVTAAAKAGPKHRPPAPEKVAKRRESTPRDKPAK